MRLLAVCGVLTGLFAGASIWLAWEARRTERMIADGLRWDTAASNG